MYVFLYIVVMKLHFREQLRVLGPMWISFSSGDQKTPTSISTNGNLAGLLNMLTRPIFTHVFLIVL